MEQTGMAKITEADYVPEAEAARLMGMPIEQFRERLRWGRGPHPVGIDPRTGERLWVRKMCKVTAEARRQGHVV